MIQMDTGLMVMGLTCESDWMGFGIYMWLDLKENVN
jgi:hypothetical protein